MALDDCLHTAFLLAHQSGYLPSSAEPCQSHGADPFLLQRIHQLVRYSHRCRLNHNSQQIESAARSLPNL
jgi:hypothetical protein